MMIPQVVPAWIVARSSRPRLVAGGALLLGLVMIVSLPGKRVERVDSPSAAPPPQFDPSAVEASTPRQVLYDNLDAFLRDERSRLLRRRAFELSQGIEKERANSKNVACFSQAVEACIDAAEQSRIKAYRDASITGNTAAAESALFDYSALNVLRAGASELAPLRPESFTVIAEAVTNARGSTSALELELSREREMQQIKDSGGKF